MKKNGFYIGYIYMITCLENDKKYIGKTTETINRRFKRHYYDSQRSNFKFQKAIRKYGFNKFVVKEIEKVICEDLYELNEILNEKEIYNIMKYNTFKNGYNSTAGGEGTVGRIATEEHKNKNREFMNKMLENVKIKVIVYSINGQELAKCDSIVEASEITGITRKSIKQCCEDKVIYKKDYLFKFDDGSEFNLSDYSIGIHHSNKPIAMYDLDGNFIKTYKSIIDASIENNLSHIMIIRNCKKKCDKVGDYIFVYLKHDGTYKNKIEPFNKLMYKNHSPIVCYTKEGKFIRTYNSIKEAAEDMGLFSESISMVCSGKNKTCHGYIFRYFTDEERKKGEAEKNDL